MSFDWKALVGTVAPTIATALGGPLAGLATKAIAGAVLGDEAGDPSQIAAALQGASPDTLLKLKEAENNFVLRMRELDIDIDRINAEDRDSARKREASTGDSRTPQLLALGVTAGFFGILGFMMVHGAPDHNSEAMLVMLGSLGTAFAGVVSYYFGSSAGSKAKTDAMSAALNK